MADRAVLLRGFVTPFESELIAALREIVAAAPFRQMFTPGGHQMSVAMTNCGNAGWVTDRSGYRYDGVDPLSGKPWPAMPPVFRDLALRAAAAGGFEGFSPDACLVNRYEPGARMSLHQDKDEGRESIDAGLPVVSISLGDTARFLFGGVKRREPIQSMLLESGDAFVFGGPARLRYHGVSRITPGTAPAELGIEGRFNLTFRRY